jgi:poly(3-hydroxybutyrate) depolymerase
MHLILTHASMRVVSLAVLALALLVAPATCEGDKSAWTCESDGYWHENGVKSQYTCSESGSKADDGSKGESPSPHSKGDEKAEDSVKEDGVKEDAATVCPGDGNDAGFDSFPTVTRTCVKGPPNDATRCWWTYTPPTSQTGPIPLVVDMHGGGGCASHRARWSGFKALADAKLFAVAWPAGYANEWGTCGSDCEGVRAASGGKSIRDTDDITFLAALVAFEAARPVDGSSPPVDATRVYLTGFSMGCMMAHRFAMERSDLIAGFGCHGGDLIGAGADLNTQKARFSIEPTAAFMTGGSLDAWFSPSAFVTWRTWNGCDAGDANVASTNVTSPRVGNIQRGVGCDAPAARYVVFDAGHAEDDAMAAATWDFLSASTRPGANAAIAEVTLPVERAPVTSAGSRMPVGVAALATAAAFFSFAR